MRVDDMPVAMNWDGLVGGMLANSINLTEKRSPPPTAEGFGCEAKGGITNTRPDGDYDDNFQACFGWTSMRGHTSWGVSVAADEKWSQGCDSPCFALAPIYCLQQ